MWSRKRAPRRWRRVAGVVSVAVAAWIGSAGVAGAQGGFGLHGGATIDPDQGFFGMHFVSGPLAGQLRLQPGADVGFGDDLTLVSLHIDLVNWFELNPRWRLYFGGGPAVNIYRFDVGGGSGQGRDSFTETQGGFETLVGFGHASGLMFEMRVGTSYSPNLRFSVGYTFQ